MNQAMTSVHTTASAPAVQSLKHAVTAAVLTAILTVPILGLQLKLDGYQVVLEAHWRPVWIAVAAVFLFQLFKPALLRAKAAVRMPAIAPLGAREQRAIVWALVALGFVWPFIGSRGAIDIATLALIYVILGLGLNIVVGFAGLLDLGYVGFYAVGGYTHVARAEGIAPRNERAARTLLQHGVE